MAPTGTLICLVIAYPLAYFLALGADPRTKLLLLILVIAPFWTSTLIRIYAWIFILGGKGIPALLANLGFDDIRLINTPVRGDGRHRLCLSAADGVSRSMSGWRSSTKGCSRPRPISMPRRSAASCR